jgi:hypothetical protein
VFIASNIIVNSFGIIKQLLPALKVNIIIVHPRDVVFPEGFARGEMYSIQHYVAKFFSDFQQVGGFFRVLRFPPPIKQTAMI